ncbi:hypothetical protein JQ631_30045 [Bradyrhizobium manausense]|uniref:hypothetical protein n=1 Tax=Bradyrhizobium manausense TaxID=989370 RepID=UPI001BACB564|nr:hypothetical protein [Bradyrhizobium manausense]MBR0793340.1 hypothetical protein [Bradyrhizobium manausense]
MIFDVSPSQIESLDQNELVQLLGRLLHAEAQNAGIALRGITVPMQITVADGGEDGRISWSGGLPRTDYIPSRFAVFQSKATDPGAAGWKKEAWTKATQKKGAVRKLNAALTKAIRERGSYLGFTSAALVGEKLDQRIEAIRAGISETGADPDRLAVLDIYDANKIAEWSSRHPAVAVWLNEHRSGLTLGGFQTVDSFGKLAEVGSIQYVPDTDLRYSLGSAQDADGRATKAIDGNTLTSDQAKERIYDHLCEPRRSVRLIGPSGLGKTRFVFELLRDISTIVKQSRSVSALFCDYRTLGQQLLPVVQRMAERGSPTLLVVDECSRESALQLSAIVSNAGSVLRLLTIDIDDRPLQHEYCLNISLKPSGSNLVEGIIKQRLPQASAVEVSYISNLCGGFPKIAVLATHNYAQNTPVLRSIEDVVSRVLSGAGIRDRNQVKAIECLALFERLGSDDDFAEEFDLIANALCSLAGDEMHEHLARAASHDIVDRRGRFFSAQPIPIAAYLGARRLEVLRVKTLLSFISTASPSALTSFFAQWRYFDTSKTAREVARRLLGPGGMFASLETLNTEHGSKCFDALVHVDPDAATDALKHVLGDLSLDDLKRLRDGRRHIVWALEKLVFRHESFAIAARLLMRLGAAETERFSNNASGLFIQLFQLHLSGTEAEPAERFAVLDEGLASNDEQMVDLCIGALEKTLRQSHFTRSGSAQQIGTRPPLSDWHAKIWGEVFDFHRNGMNRLLALRSRKELSTRCERIVASHLRELMGENLFSDIEAAVKTVASEKGLWLEALESLGDWLYYDRRAAPEELARKVRELYNLLLPTDLVDLALLYTKFWAADIRDPDLNYDYNASSTKDFEYSTRMAQAIAREIARTPEAVRRAIQVMAIEELHNGFPFARELAQYVGDPIIHFKEAVSIYERSEERHGAQFIRGFLNGVDGRSVELGDQCVAIALGSSALSKQAINVYTAVGVTPERLDDVIASLRRNEISARDCAYLSYGRGIDHLPPPVILPLLSELATNHGAEGNWTSLEIISMYQHSRAELDASLAEMIETLLTSPKLLEKVGSNNRDSYLFEQSADLLVRSGRAGSHFISAMGDQLSRICQSSDSDVIFALDGPIRKTVKKLLAIDASAMWTSVSRFYEIATATERYWLERIVGPPNYRFDGEGHNEEGILFAVPHAELESWAKIDPTNRAAFLCDFYPIIKGNGWHPAFDSLASKFGDIREFRDALSRRLYPTSWSGSMVPLLEVYLSPLQSWFGHPIPKLALWARESHRSLEKRIAAERRDDEEE